jgi:hypothetical protein
MEGCSVIALRPVGYRHSTAPGRERRPVDTGVDSNFRAQASLPLSPPERQIRKRLK